MQQPKQRQQVERPPWRPTGGSPLPKGQVPVRRPLIGSKYGGSQPSPAGWASNAQSPGIHWGVATTPNGQPMWSPYNPWGSWEPYSPPGRHIPSPQSAGMTLKAPHLEPPEGALHGAVDAVHAIIHDASRPIQGRTLEAEAQRLRNGLSKVVDCLGKCLQVINDPAPEENPDLSETTKTIPGGASEYMPDRSDPSKQRKRELEEDRFRIAAAREALARQRSKAVGGLGESGLGEPDKHAEPGKVPTIVPDEDVAATLLLLGCLRDVAENRRAEIFPANQPLTLEQRMIVDFLDSCHTPNESEEPEFDDGSQLGGFGGGTLRDSAGLLAATVQSPTSTISPALSPKTSPGGSPLAPTTAGQTTEGSPATFDLHPSPSPSPSPAAPTTPTTPTPTPTPTPTTSPAATSNPAPTASTPAAPKAEEPKKEEAKKEEPPAAAAATTTATTTATSTTTAAAAAPTTTTPAAETTATTTTPTTTTPTPPPADTQPAAPALDHAESALPDVEDEDDGF